MTDPSIEPTHGSRRCTGHRPNGEPCGRWPRKGAKVCDSHGGAAPQVRGMAAVRAEVMRWGLGDSKVDAGETLLRLLSQSSARAEHYAQLLGEAYDAAERLRTAHEADQVLAAGENYPSDDEPSALQAARLDLDRIFGTGGVSALIGHTYDSTKDGGVYAAGEAIRGLAQLEAQERDRCATFATKAIAAGLAEREVRLAEKETAIAIAAIHAALDAAGIAHGPERGRALQAAARHLRAVDDLPGVTA